MRPAAGRNSEGSPGAAHERERSPVRDDDEAEPGHETLSPAATEGDVQHVACLRSELAKRSVCDAPRHRGRPGRSSPTQHREMSISIRAQLRSRQQARSVREPLAGPTSPRALDHARELGEQQRHECRATSSVTRPPRSSSRRAVGGSTPSPASVSGQARTGPSRPVTNASENSPRLRRGRRRCRHRSRRATAHRSPLPTAETVGPSICGTDRTGLLRKGNHSGRVTDRSSDHEQSSTTRPVDEAHAHDLDDGTDGRPPRHGGNADRDPLVLLHRPQLGDREVPRGGKTPIVVATSDTVAIVVVRLGPVTPVTSPHR